MKLTQKVLIEMKCEFLSVMIGGEINSTTDMVNEVCKELKKDGHAIKRSYISQTLRYFTY